MRILSLYVFFFVSVVCYSQSKLPRAVFGVVNDEFVSAGEIKYCSVFPDRWMEERESLNIAGIDSCYDYKQKYYYNVYIDGKSYYIEQENVYVRPSDIEILKAIPDSLKTHFTESVKQVSIEDVTMRKKAGIELLRSHASKGITIKKWVLRDASEYTSGKNVSIDIYNPTKKTIKYMWFSFKGFNPVKDVVIDPKKKKSLITVEAVGPIEPYQSGEYYFRYVWFSDLVSSAQLVSVKVQYTDGTFKTITKPTEVLMPVDLRFVLKD